MAFPLRVLTAFFIASAALAAPAAPATDTAKIRAFADELFDQEEYFRASTEYMRIISLQPGSKEEEQLKFRIAQCSYRAGRYDEAAQAYLRLSVSSTSTDMVDRCRLVMAACRYRQEDFPAAAADCGRAIYASPKSPLLDRFTYLKGMSLAHSSDWKEAINAFAAVPGESPLSPSSRELGGLCVRVPRERRHNPLATGTMSLLVPGLGQAVCGYGWDGFTAFLLSAGSLAIGLAGTERGDRGMATAGYALFALWHPANVIGGANAARRANHRAEERAIGRADSLSMLSLE